MAEKGGDSRKDGLVTGKRAADEDLQEAEGGRQARRIVGAGDDEVLFSGPKLGSGPRWRLRAGMGAAKAEKHGDGALFRCGAMLDQALSCSALADVRFLFDDGRSLVSGHRGMLCSVSSEFLGMFESGMKEAKTGEVRVREVSRESFRGFLELLYLGRAGKESLSADGREVWVLADLYDVEGVKLWLMGDGLEEGSVCAAVQYALEGGGFLDELLEVCRKWVRVHGLSQVGEEALRGVSAEAVRFILEAHLESVKERDVKIIDADALPCRQEEADIEDDKEEEKEEEEEEEVDSRHDDDDEDEEEDWDWEKNEDEMEERYKQSYVMAEGFKYIARWAKVNGGLGCGNEDVDSLVGLINMSKLSYEDMVLAVRPSGLVREEQFLSQLVETGKERVSWAGLHPWLGEELLRGMCVEHAGALLQVFQEREETLYFESIREALDYIDRWAKVNAGLGRGNKDVDSLVGLVDLSKVRYRDLVGIVKSWGNATNTCAEQIADEVERRLRGWRLEGRYEVESMREILSSSHMFAVTRKGGGYRVACDHRGIREGAVYVYDIESRKVAFKLNKLTVECLAYNDQGELLVGYQGKIIVYDAHGQVAREISGHGMRRDKEFNLRAIAVNGEGDLILVNTDSVGLFCTRDRVEIFRGDGTYVRWVGQNPYVLHELDGRILPPSDGQFRNVCGVVVGPDGRLVVLDDTRRAQVFEPDGRHVMTIHVHADRTENWKGFSGVRHVAVTSQGAILISEYGHGDFRIRDRHDCEQRIGIQVFDRGGALLGHMGEPGLCEGLNLSVCVDYSTDKDYLCEGPTVLVFENDDLLMIA